MVSMSEFINGIQNNKNVNYSSVNTYNSSINSPAEKEQQLQISPTTQDTFEKRDKNKTIKNVAIGTGIAILAYSTFALVKYKSAEGSQKIIPRLTKPIKLLLARINPNGFKPSVTIEEDELKYVAEVSTHIGRLPKNQRKTYIKQLFEKSTFTEEGKKIFFKFYGKYLNQ